MKILPTLNKLGVTCAFALSTFTADIYASSANLALHKSVLTDSAAAINGQGSRQSAVDGDMSTEWSGFYPNARCSFGFCGAPEYFAVDLAAEYDISNINVVWGANFPSQYQLQYSPDQVNWATVYDYLSNGNKDSFTFDEGIVYARYIRLLGVEPAYISRGWSVVEFEVFNQDSATSVCDNIVDWNSSQVYLGGHKAVFNNTLYQAKWWTLGTTPSDYQWGPWLHLQACEE